MSGAETAASHGTCAPPAPAPKARGRALAGIAALSGKVVGHAQTAGRQLGTAPTRLARGLHRRAQPALAPLGTLDWHRIARPAPLAAMGVFGIVGVTGYLLADRLGLHPTASVVLTTTAAQAPTAAPVPELATLAVSAEILQNAATAVPEMAAAAVPVEPADLVPPPSVAAPIVVTQSASAAHGRLIAIPEPLSTAPRQPALLDATQVVAPPGWSDISPIRDGVSFPSPPEAGHLDGIDAIARSAPAPVPNMDRVIAESPAPTGRAPEPRAAEPRAAPVRLAAPEAAPILATPPSAPVQVATAPTSMVLTAAPADRLLPNAPTLAAVRVAPRPRPVTLSATARPASPAATAAVDPGAEAAAVPITEASAPITVAARPMQRPVQRPTVPQGGDTMRAAAMPDVTLTAAPAPESPRPATRLEVIAPDGPSGLEVLAIVGTGTGRQALVRTGPSQTTVLVPGSNLASWRVVEVRRDGVVLTRAGTDGFLPFER